MFRLLASIFALVTSTVAFADRGLGGLFDDAIVAKNVAAIRSQAATMVESDRFEFLSNWVLPNETHNTIRLSAQIAPDWTPGSIRKSNGGVQSTRETLIAPALELLELAKRSGRLDEVLQPASAFQPKENNILQLKARAALLTLIYLHQSDADRIDSSTQTLQKLIDDMDTTNSAEMWPETLVAWYGMQRHPTNQAVSDLVDQINQVRSKHHRRVSNYRWSRLIEALTSKRNYLAAGGSLQTFAAESQLKGWITADRIRASTSQSTSPNGGWIRTSTGELKFHSSGVDDYLLFRSPLRGNYEVEADIGPRGHTVFYIAGALVGPVSTKPNLRVGNFQTGVESEPFARPFSIPHVQWAKVRAVVRDGVCSVYLHGRLVRQLLISKDSFPWFGFHSAWRSGGSVRNVAITGRPIVPDAVSMSGSKTLDGWLAYHSPEIGAHGGSWSWQEAPDSSGEIVGARWNEVTGTWREQLLQYQRPLLEDGSVDYQFFYKAGESIVHPSLGRLAFLLKHDGVRTHWVTNCQHDRTEIPPDNILPEPFGSVREDPLDLKDNDWNHMRLSVTGSTVSLQLNQRLIYSRTLQPNDASARNRQFGLFYYHGEESVRVRNVVMQADWPKTVPKVDQQELADTTVAELEQKVAKLNSVFEHDFSKNGLPERYFKTSINSDGKYQIVPDGVFMHMTARGEWSSQKLQIPFQMEGDFDVEVAFDEMQLSGKGVSSVLMHVAFDGNEKFNSRVARMLNDREQHIIQSSWSEEHDGTRTYADGTRAASELVSGRMRLIRLGKTVYTLFAQSDSSVFQLVGEQDFTDGPTATTGAELALLCSENASATVNWKRFRIAAEKITFHPASEYARTLHVLTLPESGQTKVADETVRIHQVTDPINGLWHLGSPEWSSDGTKIACDMSKGGVGSSHIVSLNTDGTGVKDLGTGAMPSFSPDGKEVVFSSPGIMRMNSDGTNRRSIGRGWGTQWSPDGRHIAWGNGRNITLLNTKTGETRNLLTAEQEKQIRSVYWNMGWSRNGKSIAFKAQPATGSKQTVVVADVDSDKGFKIVHSSDLRVNEDFSWHPDGRRVLFSTHDPETQMMKMVLVNRDTNEKPERIPGIPADWQTWDCAWSPDGKQILFSAVVPPTPVEWRTK